MDVTRQIQVAVVRADMAIVAAIRVARVAVPAIIALCLLAWAGYKLSRKG